MVLTTRQCSHVPRKIIFFLKSLISYINKPNNNLRMIMTQIKPMSISSHFYLDTPEIDNSIDIIRSIMCLGRPMSSTFTINLYFSSFILNFLNRLCYRECKLCSFKNHKSIVKCLSD